MQSGSAVPAGLRGGRATHDAGTEPLVFMVLDVEEDTHPAGSFLLWGRTLDSRTVAVQVCSRMGGITQRCGTRVTHPSGMRDTAPRQNRHKNRLIIIALPMTPFGSLTDGPPGY